MSERISREKLMKRPSEQFLKDKQAQVKVGFKEDMGLRQEIGKQTVYPNTPAFPKERK